MRYSAYNKNQQYMYLGRHSTLQSGNSSQNYKDFL